MSLIVPIVEGHGEVDAVPVLLKRIGRRLKRFPTVNPPYRVKASSFLKFDLEFARTIHLATAKAAVGSGAVLILFDCEDKCPAQVGSEILNQARAIRSDIPIVVCLAYREYETWFIEAIESLAGIEGIPLSIRPPVEATSMRDAKGWLSKQMPSKYRETEHQTTFTKHFDLDAASRNASFNRFVARISPYL